MDIHYSERARTSTYREQLSEYRSFVRGVIESSNFSQPESALATWNDSLMREGIERVCKKIGPVQRVVLIGIGGSSLGTEAVHMALGGATELVVISAVAPKELELQVQHLCAGRLSDLAICVVSKSGGTTETLANANVLLQALVDHFGEEVYARTVCVGNPGISLLEKAETLGMEVLPMHESIGGRYSVFTAAGLVPLSLLGHNVSALLDGLRDATSKNSDDLACESAARITRYVEKKMHTLNTFVFDPRLVKLAFWYRQLAAESLGKEGIVGKKHRVAGFIPTVSTAEDLHAIAQLYFSGFPGIFTDFVLLKESSTDSPVVPNLLAVPSHVADKSLGAIGGAITSGVLEAYKERKLPFRTTYLKGGSDCATELGRYMGVRMLEVMYLAKLMHVNAFDQPNVELYKQKTHHILSL